MQTALPLTSPERKYLIKSHRFRILLQPRCRRLLSASALEGSARSISTSLPLSLSLSLSLPLFPSQHLSAKAKAFICSEAPSAYAIVLSRTNCPMRNGPTCIIMLCKADVACSGKQQFKQKSNASRALTSKHACKLTISKIAIVKQHCNLQFVMMAT